MSETKPQKSPAIWERHMQTILTFIITALIAWVGTSVSTQRAEIAVLQHSVNGLQKQVEDFTEIPRFTQKDFDAESRLIDNRIDDVEDDIKTHDGRLDNILGRIRKLEDSTLRNGHTRE